MTKDGPSSTLGVNYLLRIRQLEYYRLSSRKEACNNKMENSEGGKISELERWDINTHRSSTKDRSISPDKKTHGMDMSKATCW